MYATCIHADVRYNTKKQVEVCMQGPISLSPLKEEKHMLIDIINWVPQDVTRHELLLTMYGATHKALDNL